MEKTLADELKVITRVPTERLSRLRALPLAEQSTLLQQFSAHVLQDILGKLKIAEIVDMLDHMDPRQAENILARIKDQKRRLKIIKKLKDDARDKIEYFLRFHPKATTSLINFNYILLPNTATIAQAAEAIEEHFEDIGKFPEILVHENGALVGEILMSTLVRERNSAT